MQAFIKTAFEKDLRVTIVDHPRNDEAEVEAERRQEAAAFMADTWDPKRIPCNECGAAAGEPCEAECEANPAAHEALDGCGSCTKGFRWHARTADQLRETQGPEAERDFETAHPWGAA